MDGLHAAAVYAIQANGYTYSLFTIKKGFLD